MKRVTLGVKMNNIPVHAVLDSGAGLDLKQNTFISSFLHTQMMPIFSSEMSGRCQAFPIVENFEEFSSLWINLGKCEACWIGAAKRCLEKPF